MKTFQKFGSRLDRIGRRRFLGGSGAAVLVGLPALDALVGRTAHAQEGAGSRLMTISAGSGMGRENLDDFIPKKVGTDYEFPRFIREFEPIKERLGIFSGLGISEGAHAPGDHGAGVPATFTCVQPLPTHANTNDQDYTDPPKPFGLGISIDQVMAQYVAATPELKTDIPSIQIALAEGDNLGDGPFAPLYMKHISWASPTEPLSPTVQPGALFDRLFGGLDPDATDAEIRQRLARRVSVLDYMADERDMLLPALGAADRLRMDQYFTSVRAVEQEVSASLDQVGNAPTCTPGPRPDANLAYPDQFKAMADLSVLALQCNRTRVISFQMSNFRNDNHYAFLGAGSYHHGTSHSGGAKNIADYVMVCQWIADQVAYLMKSLDAVQETDGTLLHNMLAIFNNDCGAGNKHDHDNLPIAVGGTAGGRFPTGRHFQFTPATPCNGMYVAALNALGSPIETFGTKDLPAIEIA